MNVIDVEELLKEVSKETPSGPNLAYDPQFIEIEDKAEAAPGWTDGSMVLGSEAPDWDKVRAAALNILSRSKDLGAACYLAKAELAMHGLPGFHATLKFVNGLISRFWETVHPQQQDEDDPIRANRLYALEEPETMLRLLRHATLVSATGNGSFSLYDIQSAYGGAAAPAGAGEPPKLEAIDSAFAQCDRKELLATKEAVTGSLACVENIVQSVREKPGKENQRFQLKNLVKVLESINTELTDRIPAEQPAAEKGKTLESASDMRVDVRSSSGGATTDGEIRGRDDVVKALEKVRRYYERYEPSSPLPPLLELASLLASKDFFSVLHVLKADLPAKLEEMLQELRKGQTPVKK